MSFFSRIFSDKRTKPQDVAQEPQAVVVTPTQEYMRLQEFTQRLNSLLLEDRFLARSDYLSLVEGVSDLAAFFENQKAAKTLSYYCSANGVPNAEVEADIMSYYGRQCPPI